MWIVLLSIPLLSLSQITTDSISVITNIKGDTLIVMSPHYVKVWHKTILQLKECEEINSLLNKQIYTYEGLVKSQNKIIDTLKQESLYLKNALSQCDLIESVSKEEIKLYKDEIDIQKSQKRLWQGGSLLLAIILIISLI